MPYRYLEDVAIADAAFEAWGPTPEEMLTAASDATLNIMVGDPGAVRERECRKFQVEDAGMDMLLFQMLQELIYFKDAERLLLRVRKVQLRQCPGIWTAIIEARGETIDPDRHDLIVDIKAVTLHRLQVEQTALGWTATVVVDV
jgi:SHS2 domain-containing protein